MAIVLGGGEVHPDDAVVVEMMPDARLALEPV
jgi:hypothetical protein